jgi:hypothetical protein
MIEGGAWGRDYAAATGEKIWGKSRVAPLVGQNRRFCAQLGQHIHANAIVELGTVMHIHPYVGAYMHTQFQHLFLQHSSLKFTFL